MTPITSTPRDLILTFALGRINQTRILISSLRSIGVRATIVLCLSDAQIIDDQTQSLIEHCHVSIFRSSIPVSLLKAPPIARYHVYNEFLSRHKTEYSRLLHVDAFDVYFQGDPFTNSVTETALHITLEGVSLDRQISNQWWVDDCYGRDILVTFWENAVVCSGTIGGNPLYFAEVVKTLLTLIEQTSNRTNCLRDGADQGHFN
jgi:hypothetical protein